MNNKHSREITFKIINSTVGVSLVEVIIVTAIMTIVMLAMMSIQYNQMKSNNYLEFQLNRVQLHSALIGQVLNDPINCACLFRGASSFPVNPVSPGATLTGVSPTQVGKYSFVSSGDCSSATIPQPLVDNVGIDNLKMTSVELKNIRNFSGTYSGDFFINLQSTKQISGPSDLSIKIPVNIQTSAASATDVNFVSCSLSNLVTPQTGGVLCGLYSSTGGTTINCGGISPDIGCPIGYKRKIFCDDNKTQCGQVHITCVVSADLSSSSLSLESGTLCGFGSSNSSLGGTNGPIPSSFIPTLTVASACNGSVPTSSGGCPSGFTHYSTCDDNGSGCGQSHYYCASNSVLTGTLPSGVLCGLHPTISGAGGTYAGLESEILCQGLNPLDGCPPGFSQTLYCDDNGWGCGQAYFTCLKN